MARVGGSGRSGGVGGGVGGGFASGGFYQFDPASVWRGSVTFQIGEGPKPLPKGAPRDKGTDPVVAYRQWQIKRRYPDGLFLVGYGVGSSEKWLPNERLAARCLDGRSTKTPHEAPGDGCGCGLYGLKDGIDLKARYTDEDNPSVVGEVYLWGRVIEHEHGYRAQYAYPKRLAVVAGDESLADLLSLTYGVPVDVIR